MMKRYLTADIESLGDKEAILKFSNGQTLNVPIEYLPSGTTEKQKINIHITNEEMHPDETKKILNELLKPQNKNQ